MPSEPFVEGSGQGILPIALPPCASCPRRAQGRCSGPQTVDSLIPNQDELLTCFDPDRTTALLQNLDRYRPPATPHFRVIRGLPAAIPVLCSGMPEVRLPAEHLYGISLNDLIGRNGAVLFTSGRELRTAFRLPPESRVCLFASVEDGPLENLWHRSFADGVWVSIGRLGFEFVTGLSFSVYEQQSRAGQLYNQDRNMASVEFLAQAGIPVVPLFCEVAEEDLEFAVRWLDERPSLKVVGGLAQGWRTDPEFERFLARMKFLKNAVSRPRHFLIIGCSSAGRVERLFRELADVTVATANLALSGVGGMWWDSDGRDFVAQPEVPRRDLIEGSFAGFSDFCEECAQHSKSGLVDRGSRAQVLSG